MSKLSRKQLRIRAAHRQRRLEVRKAKVRHWGKTQARYQTIYGSWKKQKIWNRPKFRPNAIIRLKVPQVFCLLEDPEASLKFLNQMRTALTQDDIEAVYVDHSHCKHLGLDASCLMDNLLLDERERRARREGHRFFLGGKHSEVPEVKLMFRASGLLRALGHPESYLEESIESQVITCPVLRWNGENPRKSGERDNAGTRIIEYFQRCLLRHGVRLTPTGISNLADLVTEVLGNSEDHSKSWTATGYYVQNRSAEVGICHIVLFDDGVSIFGSMSAPEAAPEIKQRAHALVQHHLKRGFFGSIRAKPWTEEALWTLCAMQQGVSSRKHLEPTRGNGSVEVINAFAQLAGSGRKMCILSGAAYILFDEGYKLGHLSVDGDNVRTLAFNSKNDLHEPPDGDKVFGLQNKYGGTVVSLRFTLDTAHLQQMAKENEHRDS